MSIVAHHQDGNGKEQQYPQPTAFHFRKGTVITAAKTCFIICTVSISSLDNDIKTAKTRLKAPMHLPKIPIVKILGTPFMLLEKIILGVVAIITLPFLFVFDVIIRIGKGFVSAAKGLRYFMGLLFKRKPKVKKVVVHHSKIKGPRGNIKHAGDTLLSILTWPFRMVRTFLRKTKQGISSLLDYALTKAKRWAKHRSKPKDERELADLDDDIQNYWKKLK